MFVVKRVYEPPARSDGLRVLVDRLWPRGLTKEAARIDRWAKEIAPSAELRKEFHHQPGKWSEFRERYFAELAANPAVVAELRSVAKRQTVTLLYAAKDTQFNNAVALAEYLRSRQRA